MKRRKFIKHLGKGLYTPLFLNGTGLSFLAQSGLQRYIDPENERVLVLIQLLGGNDGLNTIIPLDQYQGLSQVRKNLLIPENRVIQITDNTGLHPALGGLQPLLEEGRMNVVQSVGYPNQNRSHFRSTDIWTTGSPADQEWSSGWLGRYFETDHPDFPNEYPNESIPDPFAITMGSIVSETCQGSAANFSLAVQDPFALVELTEPSTKESNLDEPYFDELNFLKQSILQTNAYSQTVFAAAEKGDSRAEYPDTELARKFKNVATLISGGLKTKVYLVSLGGFDTHANQVNGADVLAGEHATLLRTLAESVSAFQQDLKLLGIEERVLGLTFSEFGRRIRSNDSLGTDHGTAAPLMLFGPCVRSGVIGENPDIDKDVDKLAGVPMQFDFRDIYGTVLRDWFDLPHRVVQSVLQHEYTRLPIIRSCSGVTSTNDVPAPALETRAFPSPFHDTVTIQFRLTGESSVHLSIYNALGSLVTILFSGRLAAGSHDVIWNAEKWPAGSYFYRLQAGTKVIAKTVIKTTS